MAVSMADMAWILSCDGLNISCDGLYWILSCDGLY